MPQSPPAKTMIVQSPAKLNIFLEVTGLRPDGYRELDTVMLRTQFCDQLSLQTLPDGMLRVQLTETTADSVRADFPLDSRNLILQAATALQLETGCRQGALITVHKVIPPQSGLGGGSSNAASTLLALNQLWQCQLPHDRLHRIAAQLGSDINFLLSGTRAAVCRGRGEIIQPFPICRTLFFVALRPPQGNRTSEIFHATSIPDAPRSSDEIVDVLTGKRSRPLERCCFNRLTEGAIHCNPEMARLLRQLELRLQRPALMSGSGSTCFVVARSFSDARHLKAVLRSLTGFPVWILRC